MRLKSLQIKKRETQSEKSRQESKVAPDLGDAAMETKSAAKINVYRPRVAAKLSGGNVPALAKAMVQRNAARPCSSRAKDEQFRGPEPVLESLHR